MQALLRTIERHLKRTGETPTRFGRESVGDPRFVCDLRNGREARPQTAARIRAFIESRQGSAS